ncbi:FUSC family protein [Sediminibacillus massiliensis]|uniref:FUSC family protein n=1 Tax=Sediminibacillus massiliensis TaxID=1926277 RepID=UPI00098885F8|nr:FUSC family protein [Sediminibacillus massiliensis]
MKHLQIKYHWIGRLIASDPGRKRLQQAGKATLSLISAVFTMLFILRASGSDLLTPAIISGMAGMMAIMAVMDDTEKEKKVTTILMAVSASVGITVGSLLGGNPYYVGTLMVLVIFSAFYFSRFGSRYFSLGMIAFFTVYISSFLMLDPTQFPWFYLGAVIGISYAFLYNFLLFKNSAQILNKSMRSFHIQANLTFNLIIRMIQEGEVDEKWKKILDKNVDLLGDYARNVSGDLNEEDVDKVWPGLSVSQIRLYVFDAAMLVQTLADSVQRLKKADAFQTHEIRRLLVWIIQSLRDVEVLAPDYKQQNLLEAEKAIQTTRLALGELLNEGNRPGGWLYLIRRIESIANHVIEAAFRIQQSLTEFKPEDRAQVKENIEEVNEETEDKERGLKPTTKKAYQALVAGTISIIVGYIISPIQPYWVILTAFIVLLGTELVGRTYVKGFQRSVGTIFGAIIGFGLANGLSGQSALEVVLIFLVVFLAFYLFTVSYTLMSLFITMLIAFMYDILLGGISIQLMGARVLDTIAGAAIAFGVSAVVLPKRTKDRVADAIDEYLAELSSYVTIYVRSFREEVNVKELSDNAFEMDKKLQIMRDQAHPLLQQPGLLFRSDVPNSIAIFSAINYYAKHLVASSYQKNFEYPEELNEDLEQMEQVLGHNIGVLRALINGENTSGTLYKLERHRERIEKLAPGRQEAKGDLIHHLYYVWKVNQSLVHLGEGLGATSEIDKKEKQE